MNPFIGLKLLFRALNLLLSSRRLRALALLPGIASGISTIGLFIGVREAFTLYHDLFPSYIQWLNSVAYLSTFLCLAITVLLAPFLIILVALPLCEPLAAAVDQELGGEEIEVSLLSGILGGLSASIKLALGTLMISLLFGLLSLLPIIGLFFTLFQLLFITPLLLAFDVTDFLFSRRNLRLSQRLKRLASSPLSTASVGIVIMPLLGTPVLSLLGAPIAAIMGTLYARELENA